MVGGEDKCIPSAYVCDEENDCDNGEDEAPLARCNSYAQEFVPTVNMRLADKEVEQWSNRNLEACLKQCIFAKDFVCRGVNYEAEEKQCVLLENNIGMLGSLEESFSWSYYERRDTAVECDESVRCRWTQSERQNEEEKNIIILIRFAQVGKMPPSSVMACTTARIGWTRTDALGLAQRGSR